MQEESAKNKLLLGRRSFDRLMYDKKGGGGGGGGGLEGERERVGRK